MITDISALTDLKKDWGGINRLLSVIKGTGYILPSGELICMDHPPESYNIPFLLSYGVLENTLLTFHAQGIFIFQEKKTLNNLMEASRPNLLWKAFDIVNGGRIARNKLAHEAVLLTKDECIRFVDAIRLELVGWSILSDTTGQL